MPGRPDLGSAESEALDELRQALVRSFCAVLARSRMPPMTVLRLAGMALGSVYREVAAAHRGPDACPCGWEPWEEADLEVLRGSITDDSVASNAMNLLAVRAAGSA
ncbi:hypothetical protein [Enterovirga aerilata]|uniref:Uncharacterized protein n=1 Tax=Enterovirga aerilata TaxID=2730920 RepID=A0A849I0W6_9HYPH|nr:hypothetical protein [Enterovirga sp. DB1703]NNM73406.1 hypothetical protein [Enterovirga sp. DB1703]